MKRFTLFFIMLFSCLAVCERSFGQVIISDDFEDGSITTTPTWAGATTFYNDNNTAPILSGTKSLRSNTGTSNRIISLSNTINLNAATTTWRMLYRNNSASNAASTTGIPASGGASWRFWVAASSTTTSSANGYALVHNGTTLQFLKYTGGTLAGTLLSYTFAAYTNIFSIKLTRGPGNLWTLYVNTGTAEPTTVIGSTNDNTYFNSGSATVNTVLESCDNGTSNRFVWDNIKISQSQLTVATNTNSVITSSTIIYQGSISYPIYSFQLTASDDVPLKFIHLGANSDVTGALASIKIIQSVDNDYNTSGDNTDITASFSAATVGSNYFEFYNNSGVTIPDGMGYYYFIVGTSKPTYTTAPSPLTLTVANTGTYNGVAGGSFIPLANTGFNINTFSYSSPTPLTFGLYYNWTGSSTVFSNTGSWTPTGIPGTNDVAQIGVTAYSGSNQPNVGTTTAVNKLIFGTNNTPVLTLGAGKTLTVNDDLTVNASATASMTGTGTLTVTDDFINSSSASFAVNSTSTLNIAGDFTNNTGATFTAAGTSNINFNGVNQTITNSNVSGTTPTVAFGNLTLTGSTNTLAGLGYYSINAASVLTLGSSTIFSIPSTSTHLVFLTGTTTPFLTYAQIATIPSTSSIQGTIDYQVYFTGGAGYRNYRSMGSPVYDNTTTYSASNGTYNLTDLKNTFIITGYGGTAAGFDASTNNGITLKKYVPSSDSYSFVTNLTTEPPMATGKGFYMYYRGNRTPTGTVTAADPFGSKTSKVNTPFAYATPETNVVHTYTGIPNQGDISTTFGTWDSNYYFLSNPYAATLDANAVISSTTYSGTLFWMPVTSTYINAYVYTWNPASSTYATYDQNNSAASTNGAKRYIVPGQGFFVQAATYPAVSWLGTTATPYILTLTESMKSTANNANAVRFSSPAPATASAEAPIMRLRLYKDEFYNDEIGIVLKNSVKDSLDNQDATHREWANAILSTITPDNKYLSIDKRPIANKKTTIPLYINTISDSVYTFKKTYGSPLMQNYKVNLYDNLLKDSIDIAHNDYAFRIDLKRPETFGGKRFTVTIEQLPSQPSLLTFEGKLNTEKKGVLDWKTSSYKPGATYQLQRSQDNQNFMNIGEGLVYADSIANNFYELVDNDIKTGKNYYRLIETDMFNKQTISGTVTLANPISALLAKNSTTGFTLYPNPIVSDSFSILSDKNYSGKITLTVYSSNSEVKHTETLSQISSSVPIHESISGLRHGVYFIEIRVDNKVVNTLKFIKQ